MRTNNLTIFKRNSGGKPSNFLIKSTIEDNGKSLFSKISTYSLSKSSSCGKCKKKKRNTNY